MSSDTTSIIIVGLILWLFVNIIIMGLYRWFFGYIFRLKDIHTELNEMNESLSGINESLKEIVNQYQGP